MARSSRAKIIKGVWTRKVPIRWKRRNGRWRTAIDMSVLEDPRLRECRYIFEGDSTVSIAVEELRRAVVDGPSYDERKWGPFDIDPKEGTVAGHAVQMRVLHNDEAAPKDSPEISQLKRELEALQSLPQNPETLRQIQRVLKMYERPSAISRYVKRTRGDTCQFCGQRGFVKKRDGKLYCEVHHLFHLSKSPPPDCLAPEYLVVLCATCHRRMHYADVGEAARDGNGWRVRVDDTDHRFLEHGTA